MNGNLYALIAARFPADRGAVAFEMLDARTVSYGELEAGAGEHRHPHLRVGLEGAEHVRDRPPHIQRDRVAALGVVEDHPADLAVLAADQLFDTEIHVAFILPPPR